MLYSEEDMNFTPYIAVHLFSIHFDYPFFLYIHDSLTPHKSLLNCSFMTTHREGGGLVVSIEPP